MYELLYILNGACPLAWAAINDRFVDDYGNWVASGLTTYWYSEIM